MATEITAYRIQGQTNIGGAIATVNIATYSDGSIRFTDDTGVVRIIRHDSATFKLLEEALNIDLFGV